MVFKKLFFSYGRDPHNPNHIEFVHKVKEQLEAVGFHVFMLSFSANDTCLWSKNGQIYARLKGGFGIKFNEKVYATTYRSKIYLWRSNSECISENRTHKRPITYIQKVNDNKFVTCSKDNTIVFSCVDGKTNDIFRIASEKITRHHSEKIKFHRINEKSIVLIKNQELCIYNFYKGNKLLYSN